MLTIQEMFNRAWNGLKSQGWQVCNNGSLCVYHKVENGIDMRCAWGWVDPKGTKFDNKKVHFTSPPVHTLRDLNIGLAGKLVGEEFIFAVALQEAHDRCNRPDHHYQNKLEESMRELAERYNLNIPE